MGLVGTVGAVGLAAAAAAGTAAKNAAIEALVGKFTKMYSESTDVLMSKVTALEKQLTEISIETPSDQTRDAIIDAELKKPVEGSTAAIRIWGPKPSGASGPSGPSGPSPSGPSGPLSG
jgi:hypothetical protein